jgi:voltage-dependent calcium channel T type alpha-1G
MSFLTLFRIATGDNWSVIFKGTLIYNDSCDSALCSSSFAKTFFFVVYILLAQYVLINVVVAVLLKRIDVIIHYFYNIRF